MALVHLATCDIVFITHGPSTDRPRPVEIIEKYAGTQEIGSKQQGGHDGDSESQISQVPECWNAKST